MGLCELMIGVLPKVMSEVKDETPFRYAHGEILTRVVVIYDPTRWVTAGTIEPRTLSNSWNLIKLRLFPSK